MSRTGDDDLILGGRPAVPPFRVSVVGRVFNSTSRCVIVAIVEDDGRVGAVGGADDVGDGGRGVEGREFEVE